jgi:tetratricopeptide (TPR) repeat protein
VALLQLGRGEEALGAVQGTPALFAEAGDRKRQAVALANLGAALEEVGEREQAADRYLESAGILDELGEGQLRAEVMKSLSALQLRDRNPLGALLSMQQGLEGEGQHGPIRRLLKKLLEIPLRLFPR